VSGASGSPRWFGSVGIMSEHTVGGTGRALGAIRKII
jgi:hypothetical protein